MKSVLCSHKTWGFFLFQVGASIFHYVITFIFFSVSYSDNVTFGFFPLALSHPIFILYFMIARCLSYMEYHFEKIKLLNLLMLHVFKPVNFKPLVLQWERKGGTEKEKKSIFA